MAMKPKSSNRDESLDLQTREKQRSTAKDWKARSIGVDLELPSGNVALVKRVSPVAFLAGGVIPDTLAPIVNEAIRDKQGLPKEKQREAANDPKQFTAMLEMIDRVVLAAVLDPRVLPAPACLRDGCGEGPLAPVHQDKEVKNWHVIIPADRELDVDAIYVDDVDFDDKAFIMQFAMGGTSDLERFRKESETNVASLSDS